MTSPRDVVVKFLNDTAQFLRGTDQMSDAYDDLADDQRELANQGERSARELARAYDTAGDKIARDAQQSGRKVKRAYGDVGKEAGQEFASNLGESISSGDLSGLAGGTAAGLAGTFGATGPIGAALTLLGVAGATAFAKIKTAAEEAGQAANDAFEQILSRASDEEKLRSRLELYFGSYEEGLAKIAQLSEDTGIPLAEIGDALIKGGAPARALADEAERMADAMGKVRGGGRVGAIVTPAEATRLRKLAEYLDRTADATDRAAAAEERRARALGSSLANAMLLNQETDAITFSERYGSGRR
jgi:hypothetical protein